MSTKKILLLGLGFIISSIASAQSLFDMPRLFPQHVKILNQFLTATQRNDLIAAEEAALNGTKLLPNDANWHYNVACVYARRQRLDDALLWLEKAIDLGFGTEQMILADEDLKVLHAFPKFKDLCSKLRDSKRPLQSNPTLQKAMPEPLLEGATASVNAKNTQWEWHPVNGGYFTTQFLLPPSLTATTTPILYVNRDEDLTQPDLSTTPEVIPVVYDDAAVATGAHATFANGLFMMGNHPIPVIGNSILAIQRLPFWRTLPRFIATHPTTMAMAYRFAFFNQVYFYDATIDIAQRFQGDLLPFLQPFYFTTADLDSPHATTPLQPNLAQQKMIEYAVAATVAIPLETRQIMFNKKLYVWTLQRLFREAQRDAKDLFDPLAHPTAFDPKQIDFDRLIQKAKALTPETLPPMFRIVMVEEKKPIQYIDYFDPSETELIGDTSMSIGRIVRDRAYTRKMTLQAEGEPGLTYHWFIVNGLAEKIRLHPLNSRGTKINIEVDWHGRYTNQKGRAMRRVDIACIATKANGAASAPAFLSLRYLANEQRYYEKGQLISIDYRAPASGIIFEDPAITAQKHWIDTYHYNDEGVCTGWTRQTKDNQTTHFNAHGERLVSSPSTNTSTLQKPQYTPRMNARSDGLTTPALELLEF